MYHQSHRLANRCTQIYAFRNTYDMEANQNIILVTATFVPLIYLTSLLNSKSVLHIRISIQRFVQFLIQKNWSSSLNAVLLHNGNDYPSVPIGHSVHMRESFDNMAFLLDHMKYLQYNMIGLLMGMQCGYTKYCFFLCEWDSPAPPFALRRKKLEPSTKSSTWN